MSDHTSRRWLAPLALAAAAAAFLAASMAALSCAGPAVAAQAPPAISAESAILVQAETNAVVYAHNASARRAIASATKLMTALLVLERRRLADVVSTVPYRSTAGESVVGFAAGERLTVADLLRALLLPSANDAAESLAVDVAGSRKAFVAEMNERAKQLGLDDTHFENPIGLDGKRNYSSAADLVALTLELRKFPFFVRTTDSRRVTLRTGSYPRTLVNRNLLLETDPEVDGVKTGHTSRAGYVLVGSARRDGVTVVSVVLGEPSEVLRNADSRALLDYGLDSYERVAPVVARRGIARVAIEDQGDDRVTLVSTTSVRRVVRRGSSGTVTTTISAPERVSGPLPAGAKVGSAVVRERGRVVARVQLVTSRAVPRASLLERTRALLGRPLTIVMLLVLLAGSLSFAVMRRSDLRSRRAGEAKA